MPAAIDPKPPTKRFDRHPRILRKKKAAAPDVIRYDASEVMLFWGLSEGAYRARLFSDFAAFCRKHNAWVITPPGQGTAHVQIAEGSPLLSLLAALPKYPFAILGDASRLAHGRFIPVTEIQVTLWR
jgi:hypothetical protein